MPTFSKFLVTLLATTFLGVHPAAATGPEDDDDSQEESPSQDSPEESPPPQDSPEGSQPPSDSPLESGGAATASNCPTIYVDPMSYWGSYESLDLTSVGVTVRLSPVPYLNASRGSQGERGLKMHKALATTDPRLLAAFLGKGSPSDVQAALERIWANWDTLVAKGLVQPKSGDAAADLSAVYSQYLGLDCNGFAGNWSQANVGAVGPSTPVTDWADFSRAKFQRKSLGAVCKGDVIQHQNHKQAGHVGVIADVDASAGKVYIVESCGETGCVGLQGEWHTIRHNGGSSFTLQQDARTRTDHPVYIAPVL